MPPRSPPRHRGRRAEQALEPVVDDAVGFERQADVRRSEALLDDEHPLLGQRTGDGELLIGIEHATCHEHAGKRDVVEVVTCAFSIGARLTVPRDRTDDEFRISRKENVMAINPDRLPSGSTN